MNKRQVISLVAKLAFAAGILFLVFRRLDLQGVWLCISNARLDAVGLALAFSFLPLLISGWRWKRLLGAYGIAVPIMPLMLTVQVGQFFSLFLPGPVGDDMIRMLYISKLVKGRMGHALTSVVIDRIVGLASILLIAGICIPANWGLLSSNQETRVLALGMLAGAIGVFCGSLFSCLFRTEQIMRGVSRITSFIKNGERRNQIVGLAATISGNRWTLALVLCAAVLVQLILCLVFYFAGQAVSIPLPFSAWVGFVPIILAANAVPITIAGIGVRDYLLVLFLGIMGSVSQTQAAAASLIVFGVGLLVNFSGGIVYLLYRPKGTETQAPAPVL